MISSVIVCTPFYVIRQQEVNRYRPIFLQFKIMAAFRNPMVYWDARHSRLSYQGVGYEVRRDQDAAIYRRYYWAFDRSEGGLR